MGFICEAGERRRSLNSTFYLAGHKLFLWIYLTGVYLVYSIIFFSTSPSLLMRFTWASHLALSSPAVMGNAVLTHCVPWSRSSFLQISFSGGRDKGKWVAWVAPGESAFRRVNWIFWTMMEERAERVRRGGGRGYQGKTMTVYMDEENK